MKDTSDNTKEKSSGFISKAVTSSLALWDIKISDLTEIKDKQSLFTVLKILIFSQFFH